VHSLKLLTLGFKLKTSFIKLTVIGASFFSSLAFGGECVEIDTERDNLTADQQRSAQLLLSNALESQQIVLGDPCEVTWKLSHIQMGDSITVRAEVPSGVLTMTTSAIEDLPRIYSQMANTMVNGVELGNAVSRDDVTIEQSRNQRRVNAEYMATIRFGEAMFSPSSSLAPMFATGMRMELDRYAIDADVSLAFAIHSSSSTEQVAFGGHINVISFVNPQAMHTPYFGGGTGYGGVYDGGNEGYGFQSQVFGGYEMFRASTMRLFFQGNVMIPFYTLDDGSWFPTMSVSMGIGFKPQPKSNNNSVPWWVLLM
jgi:hypothetical protein